MQAVINHVCNDRLEAVFAVCPDSAAEQRDQASESGVKSQNVVGSGNDEADKSDVVVELSDNIPQSSTDADDDAKVPRSADDDTAKVPASATADQHIVDMDNVTAAPQVPFLASVLQHLTQLLNVVDILMDGVDVDDDDDSTACELSTDSAFCSVLFTYLLAQCGSPGLVELSPPHFLSECPKRWLI